MATRTYDRMAPIYEWLSGAYSFGCVPRASELQLEAMVPGDDVLYAGIGPGSEALAAAQLGARVTGVDLSAKMIEESTRRFDRDGHEAELVVADLMEYSPPQQFDVVVANFLLDCFAGPERAALVERLAGFVRPGGLVLVTDTGKPRGSLPARWFWYGYQGIAYGLTFVQGITPWLPVIDLGEQVEAAGLRVERQTFHRPWSWGPVLFESLVARRPA